MTVVLTAVDLNANISRVQSDVSDLQQSTRVAQRDMQRLVRMAGRGGLPRALRGRGRSGRTADDRTIGGENVVDDTDILTIRGAFSSPVFRIDASDPATFQVAGNTATLQIDDVTKSAFDQPLNALHALYDEGTDTTTPEAILLVGSQGDAVYAVVEMTDIQFQTVTLDVQNQSRQVERAILTLVGRSRRRRQRRRLPAALLDPRRPSRQPHLGVVRQRGRGVPVLHPRGLHDPGRRHQPADAEARARAHAARTPTLCTPTA